MKTLAIRQGDLVREGQVLATLNDVQIKAELLIVRSQLGEAMGRQARLIAERDNLRSIEFPADLGRISGAADIVIHGESRLFAGNKLGRDSQKEQLELSISQTLEEIRGMQARLAAKEEEIKLVGAERDKLDALFEKRVVEYTGSIRRIAIGRGYWESAAKSRPALPAPRSEPAKSKSRSLP